MMNAIDNMMMHARVFIETAFLEQQYRDRRIRVAGIVRPTIRICDLSRPYCRPRGPMTPAFALHAFLAGDFGLAGVIPLPRVTVQIENRLGPPWTGRDPDL
jgi:hypothetical protein